MNTGTVVIGLVFIVIGLFTVWLFCIGVIFIIVGFIIMIVGLVQSGEPKTVVVYGPPGPYGVQYQHPVGASGTTNFCQHCGRQVAPGAVWCPGCGRKLA